MPDGIRRIEGTFVTRFEASIDIGPDPRTGARRRRTKRFATEQEAVQWRAAQQVRVWGGTWIEETDETMAAYLARWLASRASISPTTRRRYRYAIRRFVPELGSVPLQRLRPDHCEHAITALLRQYDAHTIAADWTIIRMALKTAVRWELLPRNPADVVDAPRVTRTERAIWSTEQVRAFLDGTRDDELSAAWHLAALSGMRAGEILALHWAEVDLASGLLTVRYGRTLDADEHDVIADTKTASSRRVIGLGPSTRASLIACRDRQRIRRNAAGDAWQETDLVFDRGDGGKLAKSTYRHRFLQAVERLGLPVIRPHDMRHGASSIALVEAGLPMLTVSRMLGHADIATTVNTYGHLEIGQQVAAAQVIESVVWDERGAR